ALGNLDDDRIGQAGLRVVLSKACTKPAGLRPDNRVGLRVVVRPAPEDFDRECGFLELAFPAGEPLVNEKTKECGRARVAREPFEGERALECFANGGFWRSIWRHRCPSIASRSRVRQGFETPFVPCGDCVSLCMASPSRPAATGQGGFDARSPDVDFHLA